MYVGTVETVIFTMMCKWPWEPVTLPFAATQKAHLWGGWRTGHNVSEGIVPPTEELIILAFSLIPFFWDW